MKSSLGALAPALALALALALSLSCSDRAIVSDSNLSQKDGLIADKPKLDQPKPIPDKPRPKLDKPKPKLDKPKPIPDKPKPKLDKPKPIPDKPKPKLDKPKPIPDKPKPIPDKPKPIPDKPKPIPDKPKPIPDKPKPIPDKPKPIPDKPKPKPDMAKPDKAPPKPDWPLPDKPSVQLDGSPPVPYTGSFPKGKTGYLTAKLTVGGYSRTVHLYLPSGLGAKPALMLTFHGTNGDAKSFISSCYAKTLADQKKVIIASPQARKPGVADWDHQYNNEIYWQTHPLTNPATNPDLLLVQAVLQEAQKAYNTDAKRTFTLGHSSGGFFSILAAMTLPHLVAGFAESSAGLVRCANVWSCTFTGKGTANTCSALSKQSGYSACMCSSGTEKPGPIRTVAPKPAAYLFHHTADGQVSSAFTCALEARLSALGYQLKTTLEPYPYHSMPYNFALNAWTFLSQHPLP